MVIAVVALTEGELDIDMNFDDDDEGVESAVVEFEILLIIFSPRSLHLSDVCCFAKIRARFTNFVFFFFITSKYDYSSFESSIF